MAGAARQAVIGPIAASTAFVMELTLVPLLLPAIQAQFGVSISALAWVFNGYGVAVAVGVLLGGWFGDAFDTGKVFRAGVVLFALGSFLVAAAGSFEALLAGRMLQGFGGGIFSPLIPLLLTRASPQRPGRILIVWGSVAGYVAALAPLFYGGVLEGYGWHLAFLFFAAVAVAAALIMPGPRHVVAPVARQPMDYASLFRAGALWMTFVYVFCTYGAITYYLFRLPVWLAEHGFDAASIGLNLSAMWLSFSGLSTLLRNRVDAPQIKLIMLAAPVFIAAGLPLSYYCETLVLLGLSAVLVGAGLACSNAPSTQLILRFAPRGMSGVSASLDITFARLGGIVTVAVLPQAGFGSAAMAVAGLCLVAVGCAWGTGRALAAGR